MATDNSTEKNFVEKCSNFLDKLYDLPRKYCVLLVFLFPLLSPKRFSFLWNEYFINVFLKDFGVGIDNKHLDYVLITIYILVFITAIVLFLYKKIKHNYIFSLFHQLVLGGIAFVYLSYRFNFFFENHFWLRKFTISYLTSVAYSDITLLALITPTICAVCYVKNIIEWFNTTDIKLIVNIKSYLKKQVSSILEWFKATNINRLIVNIKAYLKKQVGSILAWFKTPNIYQLIVNIKSYLKKQESEPISQEIQGFVHDFPIPKGDSKLAKTVIEKLLHTKSEKTAFSLGISGEWGTGKTSFLMLLEDELKKQSKTKQKNIVIIKFNPWDSTSPQAIITDFFDTFQSELGKYSAEIKYSLNDYTKKLVNTDGDTFSILKFIGNLFGEDKSIMQEQEKINEILKKINRQVFIFIDDLDRLDKNEVIEVIRLIRNSANFYNVFFIVAYDKGYVEEAIEQLSAHNKSFFLEKIFQLELHLPAYEYHHILTNLYNKLVETISFSDDNKKVEHFKEVETFIKKYEGLNQIIQNYRDVKRFVNSFSVVYNEDLAKETYFPDFFHIELLRFKFSLVYDLLKKDKANFIFINADTNSYILNSEWKTNIEKQHGEIISNKIESILYKLFGSLAYSNFPNIEQRINKPNHFDTYFAYRIFDKMIGKTEFQEATINISTFKKHIDSWKEDDKMPLFIEKCIELSQEISFINDNKRTILLEGLFYSETPIQEKDRKALLPLFSFDDKSKLDIVFKQEAKYPYQNQINFLLDFRNKEDIISKIEIIKFLLFYFDELYEYKGELDIKILGKRILYLCREIYSSNDVGNDIKQQVKEKTINFIKERLQEISLGYFINYVQNFPDYVIINNTFIQSLFGGYANFENFLETDIKGKKPDLEIISEFESLYNNCKSNGFTRGMLNNFNTLKVLDINND